MTPIYQGGEKKPRALVACECSGIVREALRKRGIDATSCDLKPSEIPGQHIQGDVLEILDGPWDLLIAHPECTHLSSSGARWFPQKIVDGRQARAIQFFMRFADSKIPLKAIENPIGIMSSVYRKPDQIIQPWQFGHTETKATCLWLFGLPKLQPTKLVLPLDHSVWNESPGPERSTNRSRTFQGIADAMADQWLNAIAQYERGVK